ncbi:MAG: SulP family inorganic anion transporter, partial [Anaerovoracaceae bacterium]
MFLKNYDIKNLKYDIPAGIIDALVTIPIAMGYAQIAGLPPVYGLYSSLLPVLVCSFMTTSKRFAFGVDAAPNALLGTFIFEMGISFGSAEAVGVGKLITLMTGLWLLLFY